MTRKFTVHATAVATAALLASATTAFAGDLDTRAPGSFKDHRGGAAVPVPAPVPYEETYKYYVSGHLGWAFASSGTMRLSADHGLTGPTMPTYRDLQGPHSVSIAVGRYITPSLRAELGFDYRGTQRPLKNTAQLYVGRVSANIQVPDPANPATLVNSVQTNTYDVNRTEDITVANHTFMLNAYYDMNRGGRFTPYIGAGIGFVKRDVSRSTTETQTCVSGTNSVDTANTACQYDTAGRLVPTDYEYQENRWGVGLAAALMAGATVHLSPRTHWDIGYRLTYMGGKVAVVAPSLGGYSSLDVGARLDHEVRTGLRFDLW